MTERALLEDASRHVLSTTGIRVPEYRWPLLEAELLKLDGRGLAAAVARLRTDAAAAERLIGTLAIPETYLFRHPGHFQALAELARRRRRDGQAFRVLSAGCSTGEEAWSAVATAAAVYLPASADFRVEGWDLDPARLESAERGCFRSWSVRGGLHGYQGYFRSREDRWEIADALRCFVRFRPVNLTRTPLPEGPAFDAILFRNVGIYWSPEMATAVVERLTQRLALDGLVLVGPSDPVNLPHDAWERRIVGGAPVLARRATTEEAARPRATRTPRPAPGRRVDGAERPIVRRAAPARAPGAPARPAPLASAPPASSVPGSEWLSGIAALADSGRYEEALHRALAEKHPLPAAGRLLVGVLLLNLGRPGEAVRWFRQAAFLEPEDPACRHWLALGLERIGWTSEAERERRNAQEVEGDGDRLRAGA